MTRLLRTLIVYCFLLVLAGCGGGGCSGCAGGAIQPISGGYPLSPERRIPHAMQIRLTQQGLRSVEAIAPSLLGGFLGSGFTVPRTDAGSGITVCDRPPPGATGCTISVELSSDPVARGLELGFAPTDQITAHIRLILVDHNLTLHALGCDLHLDLDTHGGSRAFIGVTTNIAIRQDTHAERRDYFAANLVSPSGSGDAIQLADNLEDSDFSLHNDEVFSLGNAATYAYCAGLTGLANLSVIKNVIINQLTGQLTSALGPVQDALAASATPDPPGCPTGTTVDGTKCSYPDGTHVPMLLGTDGHGNFGALLGSITPGVHANASYVIAAGDHNHGSEVADATGMTINVFGAVTSDGHNTCVPREAAPPIPDIREWTTLRQNNIPGTTTQTDLGIGVAEDFMNSSLWHLWDSGMFCLGVTTRMSQQLSTGLFGALPQLASLRNVVFPNRSAAVALVLRPQHAPTIRVDTGADINTHPLMRMTFQNLAIDFYTWSEERYVRFMTVTTDLAIPINLATGAGGALQPTLGMASTMNTVVTNTQLLNAMPTQLAGVLGPLLGTAIGMFAGSVPAVNLPTIPLPGAGGTSAGSVQIQIPATGIQGVDEMGSRFLGLFANLQYVPAGAMMDTIAMDTAARLEMLPFDHSVYEFRPGFTSDQLPSVRLHLSVANTFGRDVEYQYRVDDLTWSQWTRNEQVDVRSDSFIAQGAHHVDIRSRVVDRPATMDTEPVRLHFDIDVTAPTATVARQSNRLVIDAHDDVIPVDRLRYNVSFDGQQNDEWVADARIAIPTDARHYEVRVRDESGNEVHLAGDINVLTIRGGESTDAGGGCGCSAPGVHTDGTTGMLAAIAAALFALSLLRRRKNARPSTPLFSSLEQLAQDERNGDGELIPVRVTSRSRRRGPSVPRVMLWAMIPSFFIALGCNCGHTVTPDGGHPDSGPQCDGGMICGGRCITTTGTCDNVCPSYQTANGHATFNMMTCAWVADTTSCDCQDNPPLPQGMAGSHLDMAIASDNTVWMSSYSAGDPRSQRAYGDLVVGRYDRAMNRVDWQHIDGVPTGGMPTSPPTTWRGGIEDPGDDVGRWNSIQLDAMGHPRVAYWDTTHDHLKYAYNDGTAWHVTTVDTAGHNGRYASLVLLAGGIPAIAYRSTIMDPMMAGHIVSRVRFAKANNATPNAATDWTITDVMSAPTSCRAADCPTGQACLQTGVCAATGSGCPAACSATQACVMGSCQDTYPANWIEDLPPGIGLFNSLRVDSMGNPVMVFYNRDRGNLMGARLMGTTWSTFIIDGERADGTDIADRGLWSTLTVASDGSWHVAYVDGWTEDLMYAHVMDGAVVGTPETIDDGSGVGMTPFDDGDHVIGDSVELEVTSMGAVRAVYQDSSSNTLRIATRGTSGWTTAVADMMNSTGYWSRIENGQVGVFYRNLATGTPTYGVRLAPAP